MRCLGILSLFLSASAWALVGCECNLVANRPLAVSRQVEPVGLIAWSPKAYPDDAPEKLATCREDCRNSISEELPDNLLEQKLLPWVDAMVDQSLAGRNCTGATTFKVPVQLYANLEDGGRMVVRSRMFFIHRDRFCR
jgi:hypothetical protein